MLEKPDLPEALLLARAREKFGIPLDQLGFLPIGADFNTAVYRSEARDGRAYFLKLRKGPFDENTVALPHFLHSQGLTAIIPPIPTIAGQLCTTFGDYTLILYPFIPGADGYTQTPTERQWLDFGATLKAIHTIQLPPALSRRIPQENFSPSERELVKFYLAQIDQVEYTEPVAAKLAAFMRQHRAAIHQVVDHAAMLADQLQQRPLEPVLCHADIHPGNLHLTPDGALYIVDWDNTLFAPKERDLALIGGCFTWNDPRQVEWFYQGYGDSPIDRAALAYYRLERIVQDFAAYCRQLLDSDEGGEDREQSFYYFTTNFLPGHEIELAFSEDSVLVRDMLHTKKTCQRITGADLPD